MHNLKLYFRLYNLKYIFKFEKNCIYGYTIKNILFKLYVSKYISKFRIAAIYIFLVMNNLDFLCIYGGAKRNQTVLKEEIQKELDSLCSNCDLYYKFLNFLMAESQKLN